MSELDFHIEYTIEIPNVEEAILDEADQRLRALTENRNDLIGAAIALEDIAGVDDTYLYQARVVAYIKPENIVAVAKRESPEMALKEALDILEQRIRAERSKRRAVWQQPEQRAQLSVFELSAREIYQTFVDSAISADKLKDGRAQIAAQLMLAEQLDRESAYYAADRILEYAEQNPSNLETV